MRRTQFIFTTVMYRVTLSVLLAVWGVFYCSSSSIGERDLSRNLLEQLDFSCNGSRQSPIALETCTHLNLSTLQFNGHSSNVSGLFTLTNDGHTAKVFYPGEQPTLIGGPFSSEYTLEEVHFHWGNDDEGSEHQMFANFYGMEIHLVHYKSAHGSFETALNFTDGVAVIGLMLQVTGVNNPALDELVSSLSEIREPGTSTDMSGSAMTWLGVLLNRPDLPYFTYPGSLTSGDCNEVVTWVVLVEPQLISRAQIAQFRTLEGHDEAPILTNRRPVQSLNGRTVFCSTS